MRLNLKSALLFMIMPALVFTLQCKRGSDSGTKGKRDWPVYLADKAASHYSSLDQIKWENVAQLNLAWIYHSGDIWDDQFAQIQTNPLIIDGILYGASPAVSIFALQAASGKEIWRFNPYRADSLKESNQKKPSHSVCRGLAYWTDGTQHRLFFSAGSRLFALNALTGRPVDSFGEGGFIDLHDGLGRDVSDLYVVATSPGIIYQDLLIQGMRVSEGADAAPGHIRAYDVKSGRIIWTFHTIPHPGEYGFDTWPEDAWQRIGGANCWTGMTLDEKRGIVYVPTGSASFDFWGGNRKGQNLFANCLIALRAETGERLWHFQTVHHDIWDRDLPAPPNLLTVRRKGEKIDAVAQITKSGYVFLFDRISGVPLFPVEERPVPQSDLQGEETWPTQPFPLKPPAFARQHFSLSELNRLNSDIYKTLHDSLSGLRYGGQFIPFSTTGTVIFPGFDGGGEWGGAAVDPEGVLYVNANEMPWVAVLSEVEIPSLKKKAENLGEQTYTLHCANCHGADRKGGRQKAYPSLLTVKKRMSKESVQIIIDQGRGFMPSFRRLGKAEKEALVAFLFGEKESEMIAGPVQRQNRYRKPEIPYKFMGYHRFTDAHGYPAVKPPWGTLSAIDLNTGEYRWQITLGEISALRKSSLQPTGSENYGGPLVTGGELLFIAATKDEMFRAFNKRTGELIWQWKLPAGGYATPATYMVDGKQYVVIAAGGGKMGTKSGDAWLAFSLTEP